ncbi:MAG: NAD(P)-dependent oxidoreductase [Chthonomonadaceae bacterium]|nr:NAD(P)-dependent oxidoreductase [Chthonomonadaceae bacterium]
MKILITGARGNFAIALIPQLLATGHDLILYDLEPMLAPENCIAVQADIRDAGALTAAMRDCDAVIHAASYHADHLETRNADDYHTVNVNGTQNVLRAMVLNRVKALVYSSSDTVHGDAVRNYHTLDESVPCLPNSLDDLTFCIGEELCRYYARMHRIHTAILRYGNFRPMDWRREGVRLLSNGVDRQDVAQANELALGAVLNEDFLCESFLIRSVCPFALSDLAELELTPAEVVERYYPGATEILHQYELPVPRVLMLHDINKAIETLGYDPQHTFESFLNQLTLAR